MKVRQEAELLAPSQAVVSRQRPLFAATVVVPVVAAAPSTSPQLWALFVLGMAQTIAQSLSVDGAI